MGNAGRVLMIPKGEYNSATTYEMLDFVYYQGRSYVCKQTSTGNAPTNTTYWQALTGDASAEIQALTNYVTENNVKNFLDVYTTTSSDYTVSANGTCTNALIDTRTNLSFVVQGRNGSTFKKDLVSPTTITSLGYHEATFTITSADDIDNLRIGHNGSTRNLLLIIPWTKTGTFTISFKLTSNDPTTEGGLVFTELMIRDASITDPTYQPYAKTNVELTQDVETVVSEITVSSGITLQDNKVIKCGDVVHVYFEITSPPDTTGGNVVIGTIPFLPRTNFSFINAYSRSNPFDIKHTVFIRGNNGEVVFPTGVTSSGVFVEGTFICK